MRKIIAQGMGYFSNIHTLTIDAVLWSTVYTGTTIITVKYVMSFKTIRRFVLKVESRTAVGLTALSATAGAALVEWLMVEDAHYLFEDLVVREINDCMKITGKLDRVGKTCSNEWVWESETGQPLNWTEPTDRSPARSQHARLVGDGNGSDTEETQMI